MPESKKPTVLIWASVNESLNRIESVVTECGMTPVVRPEWQEILDELSPSEDVAALIIDDERAGQEYIVQYATIAKRLAQRDLLVVTLTSVASDFQNVLLRRMRIHAANRPHNKTKLRHVLLSEFERLGMSSSETQVCA